MTKWGFPISDNTVSRIYDKIESKKSFLSDRKNCGRN